MNFADQRRAELLAHFMTTSFASEAVTRWKREKGIEGDIFDHELMIDFGEYLVRSPEFKAFLDNFQKRKLQ